MKNNWVYAVAIAILFGAQMVWAAESGVLLKADEMKAEPFRDAKTLKSLGAGEKVDILGKEGGWLKVKSGKNGGWVRMLSVRKGNPIKPGNEASGLLSLASGRAGTGKVVATTGVRGLSEEELKVASFNEQELQLAESYGVQKADAQQFAEQGKLLARQFDYLPAAK